MTQKPLPTAASPEHLTGALRKFGSFVVRVCDVVVESSHATILSEITRLRPVYGQKSSARSRAAWRGNPRPTRGPAKRWPRPWTNQPREQGRAGPTLAEEAEPDDRRTARHFRKGDPDRNRAPGITRLPRASCEQPRGFLIWCGFELLCQLCR
jgi:hypothetical protein